MGGGVGEQPSLYSNLPKVTNSRNGEVKMDGCTKLKQSVLVNLAPYHEGMTAHSSFLRNLLREYRWSKRICVLWMEMMWVQILALT